MATDRPPTSSKTWQDDCDVRVKTGNQTKTEGVFVGIVKNNIDPLRRGRLQVWIPDLGGDEEDSLFWRTVGYAGPFFGSTGTTLSTPNNTFTQTPNTYGMWFTSPDINNFVLLTFVAGDPGRGYWFACVPATVSHYMVPAIGSIGSDYIEPNSNDDIVGSQYPVSEYNETLSENCSYNKIPFNKKPVHLIQWAILAGQGLETDTIRGTITSSSHRESPSRVFGLSTPGRPLVDRTGPDPADKIISTREGGHTFVLDDGDALDGSDQLIRLRTAGGHQIMMNDTEEIIYIANSAGTAWLEFDKTGKIHLYGKDSINVRSENEINLHADADINIHSDKSINMYAADAIRFESKLVQTNATVSILQYGQKVQIGSGSNMDLSAATTLNQLGATSIIQSGGTVSVNGASVAPPVIGPATLKQNKLPDTVETSTIWTHTASKNTIVTIMPSHEPSSVHSSRTSGAIGPIGGIANAILKVAQLIVGAPGNAAPPVSPTGTPAKGGTPTAVVGGTVVQQATAFAAANAPACTALTGLTPLPPANIAAGLDIVKSKLGAACSAGLPANVMAPLSVLETCAPGLTSTLTVAGLRSSLQAGATALSANSPTDAAKAFSTASSIIASMGNQSGGTPNASLQLLCTAAAAQIKQG